MKPGDLVKFHDHRYSSRLNLDEEMIGVIVDMTVRPWGEVPHIKIISGGKTFEIFTSQVVEVISDD